MRANELREGAVVPALRAQDELALLEAFAIPREIRYAKVMIAEAMTNSLAPTWSLEAQMIAKRISTKNHSAHSALPGIVMRAPAGQFMFGIV